MALLLQRKKTKTMSFNVSEEVMKRKSLISLNSEPIENVRNFKYLGHVLSNETNNLSAFIYHQIASASASATLATECQ